MKKWSLLGLMLLFLSAGFAQDLMILKSGSTLKVKILKSDPTYVDYKMPEVYGDSVLQKEKREIIALVFENGYTEIVSSNSEVIRKNNEISHPVHKLSFDAFGFLGKEFYLQYEKLLSNNTIAIRVPFGINYHFDPNVFNYFIFRNRYLVETAYPSDSPYQHAYYEEKRGFGVHSGASVVIFFNGLKKVRGYLAPGVILGVVNRRYDVYRTVYNSEGYQNSYNIGSESKTSALLGTDVKLGFSIMTTSKISVALETGGGYGAIINKSAENQRLGMWRLSVLVGYNWGKKKKTE